MIIYWKYTACTEDNDGKLLHVFQRNTVTKEERCLYTTFDNDWLDWKHWLHNTKKAEEAYCEGCVIERISKKEAEEITFLDAI